MVPAAAFVPPDPRQGIPQGWYLIPGKQEFAHKIRDDAAAHRTNGVDELEHDRKLAAIHAPLYDFRQFTLSRLLESVD